MKILVLVEDYPSNDGKKSLMYVHTRNIYYRSKGIDVDVLNFSARSAYSVDNVYVMSLKDYLENTAEYDCLVLHAANVKHHFMFLKKYGNRFNRFIFFYHGHEVLKCNAIYSEPYPFLKSSFIKRGIQNAYDDIKLLIWRKYLPSVISKSEFVFVSKWMLEQFEKWVGIKRERLADKCHIIYNCVGKVFEEESFNNESEKVYDFVTIRSNLDNSKYAVDIVNNIAYKTPQASFLLIGKGEYFSYNDKAPNLVWIDSTLSHKEIVNTLNKCNFALMPTRTDAQGLMMCEMAAFGIPVITSDIPVCHEVFDGFDNVVFISNETTENISYICDMYFQPHKDRRFFENRTVEQEVLLILGN